MPKEVVGAALPPWMVKALKARARLERRSLSMTIQMALEPALSSTSENYSVKES